MNHNYTNAGSTVTCCSKQVPRKKCILYSLCATTITILLGVGIGILIWFLVFYDDGRVKETKIETEETQFMVITYNATGNSTYQPTEIVEITVDKVYSWYLQGNSEFAVNGHDVVEYFNIDSNDDAVKGDEENYTYEWQGVKWAFSTQENLDLFIENPTDYAPRYGGYCAYAMANGYTAKGDPDAWTVHNGQLYINFSKSVRNNWLKNTNGYIDDADENWTGDFDNDNWDS